MVVGGDAAGPAEEEGAAELPFQGAYLAGHRGLGEAEEGGGAGEGTRPVDRDERAQEGQIHAVSPARPPPTVEEL
ncbi:hypothetical protein GCM10020221_27940 [Streptomyces thioluteus]|uniref:Uncharacterized protein n=1 Tax=Streptomyces thioluteus TaxID=66431 RepID=A0ABN3WWS5_STRTU